ncbi:MAG: metallophosphoesterase [Sorangiineae bacterium]|nr:metallophosphoesterase [Polyangiaceae bacterium]MEB2322753.1 metallophosphoesterase [Sorangiineae bacterium]
MGRTVIVGDVHGCRAELEALLDRAAFSSADRLVSVGDLVARGPDTLGVLALLRRVGGRAVLGNHEERLLAARAARRRDQPGPRLSPSHARVLAELGDDDWSFLSALPLELELPEHGVRVVHAGVVPGIPFAEQEPWLITHIRSLDGHGRPTERWGKVPWGARYAGPPHVVFGHNAQRAPQLHADATGLDTGCVYGNRLTALVLPEGAPPPPVEERAEALVSVPAAREYFALGQKLRAG